MSSISLVQVYHGPWYGYLFPTFSKMVWFAPYKQIGIVFTLNNNNNNTMVIVGITQKSNVLCLSC